MSDITKEEREEMYSKQSMPFAPKDFRCWGCHKDMLDDEQTLKDAREGVLIVHCRNCHKSYCD
jgi:transcription elongation factor Elf1